MRGSRYCYYDTPFGVLYLYIHIQEPAYFFFLSFSLYLLHVGWGVLQNGRNRTAVSQKRTGDKNIKANSNEMMTTLGYVSSWVGPQKGELYFCIWSTKHNTNEQTNDGRWQNLLKAHFDLFSYSQGGAADVDGVIEKQGRSLSRFCLFIWRV